MQRNDRRRNMRRQPRTNIIITAVILIAIGCLIIARNVGYITPYAYSIIISWQMLLIVFGLWTMLMKRYTTGLVFACTGIFFLIPKFSWAGQEWLNTYWPLIFVFVGIMIIIKTFSVKRRNYKNIQDNEFDKKTVYETGNGYIVSNNSFGRIKHIVTDPVFKGARVKNSFGSTILDLRRTVLPEGDTFIDIECSFGRIEIFAPSEWMIINNIRPVLGGVVDKRSYPTRNSDPGNKLIIRGNIAFSGVEIKE